MKKNYPLDDLQGFVGQLIARQKNFTTVRTNYTCRVKIGKSTILFSDSPTDVLELKLINMVRHDADAYLANGNEVVKQESGDIDFSYFYDIKWGKIIEGIKVDIVSAYWNVAINRGIIGDKTVNYFEEKKDDFKDAKMARLKALGSLATRKHISKYVDGIRTEERVVYNENWRFIYLEICHEIATVMTVISHRFKTNIIFYYWDCLFLDKNTDIGRLLKTFNEMGYSVTISDMANFEIVKQPVRSYLKDLKTGIEYAIDKDQIYSYEK